MEHESRSIEEVRSAKEARSIEEVLSLEEAQSAKEARSIEEVRSAKEAPSKEKVISLEEVRSLGEAESSQIEDHFEISDVELKNGIVENRSCTDVPALIIFIVYVLFLVSIFIAAGIKADFRRFSGGMDAYGNICGYKNRPIKGSHLSGQDMVSKHHLVINYCHDNNCTLPKSTCKESCPVGYKEILFQRHCIPLPNSIHTNSTAQIFQSDFTSDFSVVWPYILLLCAITVGLSIISMYALRFLASYFLYSVLFVIGKSLIFYVIYIWVMLIINIPSRLKNSTKLALGICGLILLTVFVICYFVLMYITRNKIPFVAVLIEEGGKALYNMSYIYLLPVLTVLIQSTIILITISAIISIQVSGSPEVNEKGEVTFPVSIGFQFGIAFILFGFIWAVQFVSACQHLIVSGAVSQWYFTRDKNMFDSPILRSITNTFRYHLGSAVLGALFITIFKFPRLLIEFVKSGEEEYYLFRLCLEFLQFCYSLIENFIKFISRNAYIMISIQGEPFILSAKKAFHLLMDHLMSLAAVQIAGDVLLFVCKAGIAITIGCFGLLIIKSIENITHIFLLVLIICVLAYIICDCFFSIYEMAIDTILLNYCDDCRRNDGVNRPYFMSDNLKHFAENATRNFKLT